VTSATYAKHGTVAVITFSHPPVNTLAHELRRAVEGQLQAALGMDSIKAVVVAGEGRGFCAGAQITEFNTPAISAAPTAHDIWALLENARKPVVAAIHGYAMGGGLEFAMACHYRVATKDAKLAAPEVKLGLLPGAGGTQRLPRAVGLERALDMMLSGEPVPARAFEGTMLIDRIVSERAFTSLAVAYAASLAVVGAPLRRLRDRGVAPQPLILENCRKRAAEMTGMLAPPAIVDCAEASLLPFEEGIKVEREKFQALVDGEQSMALRKEFFAKRANRAPDSAP
jgi:3-hydroxyacyl-CoA dehydrogenase